MSPQFPERIKLAVERGDTAEAARLAASDWAAAWTAQQAKDTLREMVGAGETLSPQKALHHALLVAFETVNQLSIVRAECNALKRRIAELEARESGLSYRGTWKDGVEYRRGDFATDHGSLWHCWTPTTDRPGSSSCWQLTAKRGANGKDVR